MAPPTVLSLFSGVGGLDLALEIGCGSRVLGYCERDSYAASVLLARMEDKALEPAPVWIGDIQDMDATELRGRVDIVCGGFPCQDFSLAGKGKGLAGGKRSTLWGEMLRIANECEAPYIFAENVSAICSADGWDVEDGSGDTFRERGAGSVLRELAESGWDAEWICLRASALGAAHHRNRWFCLAHAKGSRDLRGTLHFGDDPSPLPGRPSNLLESVLQGYMADSHGLRLPQLYKSEEASGRGGASVMRGGCDVADPARVDAREQEAGHGREGTRGGSEDVVDPVRVRECGDAEPRASLDREDERDRPTDSSRGDMGPGEVADAKVRRRGGPVEKCHDQESDRGRGRDAVEPGPPRLGDPGGERLQGSPGVGELGGERPAESVPQVGGGIPIGIPEGGSQLDHAMFPPGPNGEWRGVQEFLTPAIEPGFRVMADGLAVVVDEDRVDQLRCAGNGVVPIQAACAFVELVWRLEG